MIWRLIPRRGRCSFRCLGEDRLTTRRDRQTRALRARRGTVTIEHIAAIVAEASTLALDTAIDGAFEGDLRAIEKTAERVFSEGGDYNALLGAALRHATLLHRRGSMPRRAQGRARKAALAFAARRSKSICAHWPSANLARAIAISIRQSARRGASRRLSEMITVRALWSWRSRRRNRGQSVEDEDVRVASDALVPDTDIDMRVNCNYASVSSLHSKMVA